MKRGEPTKPDPLIESTDLNRVAVRRLARRIRDRECDRVPLARAADEFAADALRRFFESTGAEAVIEVAEPGAGADRAGGSR